MWQCKRFNTSQDSFGEEEGRGIGLSIVIVDYKILVKRTVRHWPRDRLTEWGDGEGEQRGQDQTWHGRTLDLWEAALMTSEERAVFSTESAKGCGCVFICFTWLWNHLILSREVKSLKPTEEKFLCTRIYQMFKIALLIMARSWKQPNSQYCTDIMNAFTDTWEQY